MKLLHETFNLITKGQKQKRIFITLSLNQLTKDFLNLLIQEGIIRGFFVDYETNKLFVRLKFLENQTKIQKCHIVSAISLQGRKIYGRAKQCLNSRNQFHWRKKVSHEIIIISTSKGLLRSSDSMALSLGGLVLCRIK